MPWYNKNVCIMLLQKCVFSLISARHGEQNLILPGTKELLCTWRASKLNLVSMILHHCVSESAALPEWIWEECLGKNYWQLGIFFSFMYFPEKWIQVPFAPQLRPVNHCTRNWLVYLSQPSQTQWLPKAKLCTQYPVVELKYVKAYYDKFHSVNFVKLCKLW